MFRAFERGINRTGWPQNGPLWLRYLDEFVKAYEGTKRERTRDLFEESLKGEKSEYTKFLFILYAQFEEKYGIYQHAMDIYKRAAKVLNDDDIYFAWIASCMRIYGIPKCREVYDYILDNSEGENAANWCMRYAAVEVKLTEYQRARDIFKHGAQFADPSKMNEYWEAYDKFEHSFGTKETFAEMLSTKNLASKKFQSTVNIGMFQGSDDEDEDLLLEEIENHRLLSVQEQLIPKTIYDKGINAPSQFTPNKRVKANLN